jgi:hypothetical protein
MVRFYPDTELKSSKELAKREKNLKSSRMCRARAQATEDEVKRLSIDAMDTNISLKRKIAAMKSYGKCLLQLNGLNRLSIDEMWKEEKLEIEEEIHNNTDFLSSDDYRDPTKI